MEMSFLKCPAPAGVLSPGMDATYLRVPISVAWPLQTLELDASMHALQDCNEVISEVTHIYRAEEV